MKKYLAALALAVAITGTAFAGGGGGGGGAGGFGGGGGGFGGAGGGRGGFGGGANPGNNIPTVITDLSADQQAKLTAATTDLQTKLTEWNTSSQAVLGPLAPQFGQPADPAATAKYNEEFYKQNLLREAMLDGGEVAMLGILTPAQAEKWEASRLSTLVATRLGTLGLTADQKTKIDALEASMAKTVAGAKDAASLTKAKAEFWTKVAGMLNEVQITQVFAPTFAGGRGGAGAGFGGGAGAGGGRGAGAGGGGAGGGRGAGAGGGRRGGAGGGGAGGGGAGGGG